MKIRERLKQSRPILLDGAMGTRLQDKGFDLSLPLWSAAILEKDPSVVLNIHKEYVNAGSEVITANTFRTTLRTYKKVSSSLKEAEQRARSTLIKAITLAKQAASTKQVWIAGSIAPLEDCYSPELFPGKVRAFEEFKILGNWLVEAGVDLLLIETMTNIIEAESALKATEGVVNPRWVSFIIKDVNQLFGGDNLLDAVKMAEDNGAEAILINCSDVEVSVRAIEVIRNLTLPTGLFPNLGKSSPTASGNIAEKYQIVEFRSWMKKALGSGAKLIGGCCGSSSVHIQELQSLIKNL